MAAKGRIKATTVDEYLAAVSDGQRAALQKLRKTIQSAAPKAEECISYGLAAFRLNGRPLVAFGATANHCAFFPMDSTTVAAHIDELRDYQTSKGTIRFQADRPLPAALVRKLVKARIAANEEPRKGKRAVATSKKPVRDKASSSAMGAETVDDFLRQLDHPLKPVLEAVRKIILGASREVREGIKWNAPSFHFKEYFATAGLQSKDSVRVVFHKGAKVKDNATEGMRITDASGLLEWHAKERCSVKFHDMKDVESKAAALQDIVKQWIKQL